MDEPGIASEPPENLLDALELGDRSGERRSGVRLIRKAP